MERIAGSAPGRVEVAGRWFGVRGRRLDRPALTIRPAAGGDEVRALADPEHKPWSALDGEPWLAAFDCDLDLDAVAQIELSVAPDITIALRRPGRDTARPGDRLTAGGSARAPVAKGGPEPRPRPVRAVDAELRRLGAELAASNQALELERERRSSLDHALEDERAAGRQLRTELGRLRAELELAGARQTQATVAEQELDVARRELTEAERRHEQLARRHEQATQEHATTLTELHVRAGELESARDALAQPQDDAPGREPERSAHDPSTRALPVAGAHGRAPNPSLRRRYWLGRALALLVLAAVVVAIWVALHSTILH